MTGTVQYVKCELLTDTVGIVQWDIVEDSS